MDKFHVFVYMLMRDASLKQRIACIIHISIFGPFSGGKKCAIYTDKYGIQISSNHVFFLFLFLFAIRIYKNIFCVLDNNEDFSILTNFFLVNSSLKISPTVFQIYIPLKWWPHFHASGFTFKFPPEPISSWSTH